MTLVEFSSFIANTHPLHFICDAEMNLIHLSAKLTHALSFNSGDKKELIRLIRSSDSLCLHKFSLKHKNYILADSRFSHNDKPYILIKLEENNIQKNTELKLHCLEEIISNINDGIIISDNESKIALYNKSQENLEGLSSKEIVGKHLWEAYNYESIELSEHRKVFLTGKSIVNNYSAHNHKEGIPKYVSYSTYPIYKNKEIVAVYSISKNETTLKNLLSETIELKRRIRKKHIKQKKMLNNGTRFVFSDIVGASASICKSISEAEDIALIKSNLLIVGETGTGKEIFAQSIHNHSNCKNEPFVAINCGAIPENLVESTLFGTVKGSYTGATNQMGLFEEAKSGTLFLDELNSLPIAMQSKLLRVLQERKVRPVGSQVTLPVNCRIISAINEDPHKIIAAGKLRQDLFYRVSGVYLNIDPLRKRLEDIPVLAQHFTDRYKQILGKNIKTLSKELTEVFNQYSWPGNIRELEHIIENLMIRASVEDKELKINHMSHYTKSRLLGQQPYQHAIGVSGNLTATLKDIEERIIREQLQANRWNVSKTARDLGIVRQSLLYRMQKLNIDNPYARKSIPKN